MFVIIVRYLLLNVLALPFLLMGLAYDLIKLPVLIFIMSPIWLVLDLARWLKTGDFEMTILSEGKSWYFGIAIIIECFYGS